MRSNSATLVSFHPRTAVRLAGCALVLVDQLPVVVGDQLRLALQQPLHQLLGVVRVDIGQLRARQVRDQGVDGLLRVALVAADHPGGPALDPADDVLVATAVDPAAVCGIVPLRSSNGRPGSSTPR